MTTATRALPSATAPPCTCGASNRERVRRALHALQRAEQGGATVVRIEALRALLTGRA